VRTVVQTGTGQKRTQFLPVAASGGPGGGGAMVNIPFPDDEDEPTR